ncbi:hypothetical protein [Paenibacillus sp. KACC 21273]
MFRPHASITRQEAV